VRSLAGSRFTTEHLRPIADKNCCTGELLGVFKWREREVHTSVTVGALASSRTPKHKLRKRHLVKISSSKNL
jgi:hypothetical protein